jgi:hypothetical protein
VCEREFRDRSGVALLRVNDLDIVQGPPVRRSSYALHGDTSLVPGLFRSDPTSRNGPFKSVESRLRQALRQLFSPSVYGRTDVLGIVSGIQYSGAEDLLEQLREQDHGTRWRRQVARLTTSSPDVLELKTLLLANCMTDLLEVARLTLEREAKAITYIGPSRVPGERFYRMQELAVGYMDPRGENLAMFLKALSPDQLARFSDFVLKHIGFRVRLEAQGSNVSILLEDDLQRSYNLIDMGNGFSQVLPLVAQCWATASGWRPSERDPLPELIAIEQPELHLHPHYQAKLADMFVMTLQAGRDAWTLSRAKNEELDTVPPKLIVETHSDALLNRLGELVEEGRLPAEDVLVLLFEQDPITKDTTLRQSSFSPDGTLTNWPIGFFAP